MDERQGSLFDFGHPDQPAWQAARDAAMESVEENARKRDEDFPERARDFVLDFLHRNGGKSPGETITNAAKAAGIVPHDDRAFGPVYNKLARDGLIRKAGTCIRTKGHGTTGGNIWELVT